MLGVDPGLACTGWGVVRHCGAAYEYVNAGQVRSCPQTPLPERLAGICNTLEEIASSSSPDIAVIERVFVNVNFKSSMSLGQARGAALAALGKSGLEVIEIAPKAVKKNITGDSLADKKQVSIFVRKVLRMDTSIRPASDAMDALAIAIGYRSAKLKLSMRRRRRRL